MALKKLDEGDYDHIAKRIHKGNCVPFLGAGVNVSSQERGYQGLPLANDVAIHLVADAWKKLSEAQLREVTGHARVYIQRRLVQAIANPPLSDDEMWALTPQELDSRLEAIGPLSTLLSASLPDLARVAQHVELKRDTPYLVEQLQELLADQNRQPSQILTLLASLPFKLLITTNYDRLLERAFGTKPYVPVVQPVEGFNENELTEVNNRLAAITRDPVIYKIHGSFPDPAKPNDEVSSLILTEENYIQFLSVVGDKAAGIPTQITQRLSHGTILFLGYSLEDWDFRMIHKSLIESLPGKDQRKSYAIQLKPPEFWVNYWDRKGVTIVDMDVYDFAAELEAYWNQSPYSKENGNGK
jgi:hypothetical protein